MMKDRKERELPRCGRRLNDEWGVVRRNMKKIKVEGGGFDNSDR
jgi:hypothetical protein